MYLMCGQDNSLSSRVAQRHQKVGHPWQSLPHPDVSEWPRQGHGTYFTSCCDLVRLVCQVFPHNSLYLVQKGGPEGSSSNLRPREGPCLAQGHMATQTRVGTRVLVTCFPLRGHLLPACQLRDLERKPADPEQVSVMCLSSTNIIEHLQWVKPGTK